MSNATVTPIKPHDTPETIGARAFAALQALSAVHEQMEAALHRAKATWRDALTEATKTYRDLIRENDPTTKAEALDLFRRIQAGLEDHDRIVEAAKTDKRQRSERIAAVDEARKEVLAVRADDATQTDMFESEHVTGLGWASKSTLDTLYTCLLSLDDGKQLTSDEQRALLQDLSGAGIEALDLGLDAAEAIEAEVDEIGEYDPDAIAEEDIPF